MDKLVDAPHRRRHAEPNLVPIIDMLTSVIFFVLLSTTFIAFTKLTVPPSKVSTVTDPVAPPPLAAKVYLTKNSNELRFTLSWAGKEPGAVTETVRARANEKRTDAVSKELLEMSRKVTAKFSGKYPLEKTVQVGLGPDVVYQDLVSVMDGMRENLPDIVLISYDEAATLGTSMARGEGGGS